ncbi:MAG: hypothetical protein CL862_01735 [Cyanobium sp. NAT70]|nr:hypothetical protein [Cyanobium sp. NAT70]
MYVAGGESGGCGAAGRGGVAGGGGGGGGCRGGGTIVEDGGGGGAASVLSMRIANDPRNAVRPSTEQPASSATPQRTGRNGITDTSDVWMPP